MAKAGKALEQLIEHLERALAAEQNAIIEAPSRLTDKVTGDTREFDVVVTIKMSHHTLVTAIECRDWERPLDVSHVEAYETKCQHCDIQSKIIVSPVGFTENAVKKGKFLGIRCLMLSELEKLSWVHTSNINVHWPKDLNADWHIDIKDQAKQWAGIRADDIELCFALGLPFHQVYLDNLLKSAIQKDVSIFSNPGELLHRTYSFENHAIRVFHKETGELLDCDLSVQATFRMKSTSEKLNFFEYEEVNGNKITKGAIADIKGPGASIMAKVVLLERPDGSRSMVLINPGDISTYVEVQEEPGQLGNSDMT